MVELAGRTHASMRPFAETHGDGDCDGVVAAGSHSPRRMVIVIMGSSYGA